MRLVEQIKSDTGCTVLYALKPFINDEVLKQMAPHVAGFAASSLFEAKLSRAVLGDSGTVHITTPGFRPDDMSQIGELCDHVVFNSFSQYERFQPDLPSSVKSGLRINPKYSVVKDARYNPCREASKLGIPIDSIDDDLLCGRRTLPGLSGIHFHTNCDSKTFTPLLKTVRKLISTMGPMLSKLKWINMGGGYLFNRPDKFDTLYKAINLLQSNFDLEVIIEPGSGLVREAGYLVASVIDMFESDKKQIVMLDTTVNHMPEVYEYQFEPDILNDSDDGKHEYRLTGCTCLAGDIFGDYVFDAPLEIGDHIIFSNMGAYTLVKAQMFNGVNLPALYMISNAGQLRLKKRFDYTDFTSRYGVEDIC